MKFYTCFIYKVCVLATELPEAKICSKIVQRNIKLGQNSNIMAKLRFTKYFYFLSTDSVDNFVNNGEIKVRPSWDKVYVLLNVAAKVKK